MLILLFMLILLSISLIIMCAFLLFARLSHFLNTRTIWNTNKMMILTNFLSSTKLIIWEVWGGFGGCSLPVLKEVCYGKIWPPSQLCDWLKQIFHNVPLKTKIFNRLCGENIINHRGRLSWILFSFTKYSEKNKLHAEYTKFSIQSTLQFFSISFCTFVHKNFTFNFAL